MHALVGYLHHTRLRSDFNPDPLEQAHDTLGDPLWNRRENALGRLDEGDLEIFLRVNPVEPMSDNVPGRPVQFCGELGAGCASANDCHMQLAGTHRVRLRMGSNETVDQALVKPHRLIRRIQRDGMLLHTWGAEVVAPTADRHHQRVIVEGALRSDLTTFRVEAGCEEYLLLLAVQIDHLSDTIAEMMPVRLRQIVHGMMADIHAAGRYLMQ